jgi:thiamine biosynthesis lipoprotein
MGTTLAISLSSESRPASLRAIDSAIAAVRRVDDVLNDWRTDTDLARLNQAVPAEPIALPPALGAYLVEAAEWMRRTGGAFDPGIGALTDAWDLRGRGRIPIDESLRQARARSGLGGWHLSGSRPGPVVASRPSEGSWIDAGGFGKGAALRAARDQLRRDGVRAAILNFGGQIVVLGDTTLLVDVADPEDRLRGVAQLRLRNLSVSTTGLSERFVEIDGRRLGHVIDPRTGTPVAAWGSVTVVHPDPMVADILSTALFVMGPGDGLRWAEAQGIASLFLLRQGDAVTARFSSSITQMLVSYPSHSSGGL